LRFDSNTEKEFRENQVEWRGKNAGSSITLKRNSLIRGVYKAALYKGQEKKTNAQTHTLD
jgi:hypothetical protein